jgi:hypothetical protein
MKMAKIKWTEIPWTSTDEPGILWYCNEQHREVGVYPTVRDVFYWGVDVHWGNRKATYKSLVANLTKLRKAGSIPMHVIRDGGNRRVAQAHEFTWTRDEWWNDRMLDLLECPEDYRRPFWEGQPKRVWILLEKGADFDPIRSMVRDWEVSVAEMKGFSSIRTLWDIAQAMRAQSDVYHVVLLIGDWDPSGRKIKESAVANLQRFGAVFEAVDLAVTEEQVQRLNIPSHPSNAEELEKLRRHHGAAEWEATYGMVRVETAAYRSRHAADFRRVLRQAVLGTLNPWIFLASRAEETLVRSQLATKRDALRSFLADWEATV